MKTEWHYHLDNTYSVGIKKTGGVFLWYIYLTKDGAHAVWRASSEQPTRELAKKDAQSVVKRLPHHYG